MGMRLRSDGQMTTPGRRERRGRLERLVRLRHRSRRGVRAPPGHDGAEEARVADRATRPQRQAPEAGAQWQRNNRCNPPVCDLPLGHSQLVRQRIGQHIAFDDRDPVVLRQRPVPARLAFDRDNEQVHDSTLAACVALLRDRRHPHVQQIAGEESAVRFADH